MGTRTAYLLFLVGGLAAVAAIAGWGNSTDDPIVRSVYPWLLSGVVFAGSIGALTLRKMFERRDRSAQRDSVEVSIATKVSAAVFRDSLVLGVLLGAMAFWIGETWSTGLVIFAFVTALAMDFWIRHLIHTQYAGAAGVEQDS